MDWCWSVIVFLREREVKIGGSSSSWKIFKNVKEVSFYSGRVAIKNGLIGISLHVSSPTIRVVLLCLFHCSAHLSYVKNRRGLIYVNFIFVCKLNGYVLWLQQLAWYISRVPCAQEKWQVGSSSAKVLCFKQILNHLRFLPFFPVIGEGELCVVGSLKLFPKSGKPIMFNCVCLWSNSYSWWNVINKMIKIKC